MSSGIPADIRNKWRVLLTDYMAKQNLRMNAREAVNAFEQKTS